MIKTMLVWLAVLGAVAALIAGAGVLFADEIIVGLINRGGHKVFHVETRVEDCELSLLKGTLNLQGVELANPEGFKAPRMIYVEEIFVSVEPRTIFTESIRVNSLEISGMDLSYQAAGFGRSNLSVFLRDVREHTGGVPILGGGEGSGKSVVIDRILLQGGRITLSAVMTDGKGLVLPMPQIELHDIGKDSPMGFSQAAGEILRRLGEAALSAADRPGKTL